MTISNGSALPYNLAVSGSVCAMESLFLGDLDQYIGYGVGLIVGCALKCVLMLLSNSLVKHACGYSVSLPWMSLPMQ